MVNVDLREDSNIGETGLEDDSQGGGGAQPTIRDGEGREVTPVVTENWRAVTENDNKVHKTLCGETQVEPIGEDEWRITISGYVTRSQAETLVEMRPANNKLDIVTELRVFNNVDFDRFRIEQSDEDNNYAGRARTQGITQRVNEPLFEFHLQTQDDDA